MEFNVRHETKKVTTTTILIMPPRDYWDPIQSIRTTVDYELRTGPHITLVYPFLPEKLLREAAVHLIRGLASFPPFHVTLQEIDYFHNPTTTTLYLKPVDDPGRSLHRLQMAIGGIFPHCRDIEMITDDGYNPHLSLGGFGGTNALENALEFAKKYTENFKQNPITFQVTEIYVCSREGSDPFEVKYVIPLNANRIDTLSRPYFGPRSPQIPNILFIGNLPRNPPPTLENLQKIFPTAATIQPILQPDGVTTRGCAWLHYRTAEEAHEVLSIFNRKPFKFPTTGTIMVVKLASAMSYP